MLCKGYLETFGSQPLIFRCFFRYEMSYSSSVLLFFESRGYLYKCGGGGMNDINSKIEQNWKRSRKYTRKHRILKTHLVRDKIIESE